MNSSTDVFTFFFSASSLGSMVEQKMKEGEETEERMPQRRDLITRVLYTRSTFCVCPSIFNLKWRILFFSFLDFISISKGVGYRFVVS